ncbi:MAG: prepilin-type N-terminal cleavage/methylation domain-containing protein [Pseudomonadota bacterium]
MNHKTKFGFSLLELSFVLIISSILIAAVAKGNQILKRSRIVSAQSLTKSSPVPRISNLVVWHETTMDNSFNDADLLLSRINTWRNLSPNIRASDATASGAFIPTYTKNAINNLPAINFNGSNYFSFDGTSLANSDYTIIVVEQRMDGRDQNYFIGSGASGVANQTPQFGYRTDGLITFAQWGNDYNVTVNTFSKPTPVIHIFRFSSVIGKNYYRNGANMTLVDAGNGVATQGLTSYNSARIGIYTIGNGAYYGYIGEIIIFNKYINDDEMKDIKLYLSKKWQITVS